MKHLIEDSQSLKGATMHDGQIQIPIYDDGYGALWIHRDSMGINGIVRAQTWEEAYSIVQDEFLPEAEEEIGELKKEYNFRQEQRRITNGRTGEFIRWETITTPILDTDEDAEYAWTEHPIFKENYGMRPNGPNAKDTLNHGIYSKDLNGDALDFLGPKLLEELGITLVIENEKEEGEPAQVI